MFENQPNLFFGDAGEPVQEFGHVRSIFDVLEESCHWHSRAAEHPCAAHAIREAFYDGAL